MNFLQDHIQLTRSYLDEINEGESDWDDNDELIPYLNAENQHLAAVVREQHEDFFGFRHIFEIVPGQNEYWMPRTLAHLRWVEMIRSGVTGSDPDFVVDEDNRDFEEIERAQSISELYSPRSYQNSIRRTSSIKRIIFDNKIIFSSSKELSGHIRLWFIRTLPKLHYGIAAAGSADSITLNATPTKGVLQREHDIYVGSLIGIYSGTGEGQVRRITNYDATTREATIDESWLVNPNNSSVYSLISPVPDQMQELLPLGAALRASGKMNDDQNRFYRMYQSLMVDFKPDIDPRDRTSSRRIRKTRSY